MTIAEWLIPAMIRLKEAGVDSPRRDCLVLLEDTIQKDRAWVTAHPEHELDQKVVQQLDELIAKRATREPLAYIRGKAWFYRRFFAVTPDVLIPRPETETVIELLVELAPKLKPEQTIIDIGTGSSALGITAKLELPEVRVIATDISSKALAVAKQNAQAYKVDIQFVSGSLLEPLKSGQLEDTVVIVNLPYVPHELITSPEITHEPKAALFSGADGMDHYRKFWQQVKKSTAKPQTLLVESLETQHGVMEILAKEAGYTLTKTSVLIQQFVRV